MRNKRGKVKILDQVFNSIVMVHVVKLQRDKKLEGVDALKIIEEPLDRNIKLEQVEWQGVQSAQKRLKSNTLGVRLKVMSTASVMRARTHMHGDLE